MKKIKLMLALLGASSMVLASCGGGDDPAPVVDDKISSVKVSLGKTTLYEGETTKATANVTAKDGADKSVTWSSSNPAVATVDENGNVTAIKKGTAKIIATSNYDNTKKGEKTLTVKVDQGFDPEWIDDGFTYSKEFPTAEIKEFLGSGSYDVIKPSEMQTGGAYYLEDEGDSESVPCFVVVIDGTLAESYAYDLVEAGFERVYQTSSGTFEAVDPTKKYTVSMYCNSDEETYEDLAPTFIEFYKSEDVWADDTLTTDTAWSLDHIYEDCVDLEETIKSYLAGIPFVAMGAEYEINYVDNSFIRALIEAFGGDPSEYPDEFYICDYTIRDNAFDGYDEVLKGEGFEELSDEYGYYYVKDVGIDEFIIYTGFGEGGNTLYCEKIPAVLEAWPSDAVSAFIADSIESKYSVPAYDKTSKASFMMSILSDESIGSYAEIDVSEAAKTEFTAYMDDLTSAGFDVEYKEGTDESYPSFFASKGKICLEGVFAENYNETTETYDSNNGALVFYLYGDSSRHEEPGIYLPESMFTILADGEFMLPLEVVELDSPVFAATSSAEDVATVEVASEGVKVTPLAAGEATITVSVNETEYTASIVLTVSEKSLLQIELDKANEVFAILGAETPLVLPDISASAASGEYLEDYGYYQIALVTDVTEDDYADLLKAAGFAMSTDEYGYPIGSKDGYTVGPWNYEEGELLIDIYYGSSHSGGGQVLDVDDLYDGAEVCITCLDQDVALGAYNGSKNFGSVALGDTFDGCTVFTLEDNGDGTWGLFDEDGNQYGADGSKNVKTSGSGVSFDWTIEIDELGDAYLSCNGFVLAYNKSAGVFKTYAESFIDGKSGFAVQLFFADGTPGGGGGGEISGDVEQYLADIEDITVDIAAKYLGKSASQITVDYDDGDADVYVWDYSYYGFVCTDFSVEPSGNETTDLNKMKAALPSGAVLDTENTYEEDDYHDIWYSYGDYSIGIYYYDGDASFAVVPTEMLDVYFSMMYGE